VLGSGPGFHREQSSHKRAVDQSKKRNSKRGVGRGDSDARAKRDLARLTGKEGRPGRNLARLAARETRLHTDLACAHAAKESSYQISLVGERYQGDRLVTIESGTIALGDIRCLHYPELILRPVDRIGFVGPNGMGKSSLIRYLVNELNLPRSRVVYLPQEIDVSESSGLIARVRCLSAATLGEVMTFVGCLGSDPERLLATELPSPDVTGKWSYTVHSRDQGLDGQGGALACTPSNRHGSIQPMVTYGRPSYDQRWQRTQVQSGPMDVLRGLSAKLYGSARTHPGLPVV
jgi:hypothetical protein